MSGKFTTKNTSENFSPRICRAYELYFGMPVKNQDKPWQKVWPLRKAFTPGTENVFYPPLVQKENITIPPLHIKLGLMKNFVKALNREGQAFQ